MLLVLGMLRVLALRLILDLGLVCAGAGCAHAPPLVAMRAVHA